VPSHPSASADLRLVAGRHGQPDEFGPAGVRVNSVSPGPTRTPGSESLGEYLQQLAAQAPLGFVANPEDIAAAIAFLVSDEARFITGTVLDVNGGRTIM
jgi:NAD(P)-dependent dehydrogenase (short-subunit alcohol dehydrogenase family)